MRRLISRIEPSTRADDAWVVPAILLVVLHSQYTFSLSATAGLALALAGSNIYVRVTGRSSWAQLTIFITASILIYYVAGEAYYVFAACCLVYELFAVRRLAQGLSLLLVALAVKFGLDSALSYINLNYLHFDAPETSYLMRRQPSDARILVVLYVYFPACALFMSVKPVAVVLWQRLWRRGGEPEAPESPLDRRDSTARENGAWAAGMQSIRRWVVTPILLVVIAGVGVMFSPARILKKLVEIDYCSNNCMWDTVLQEARGVPPQFYSDHVGQNVYLALYHTGRLPYEMFFYPPSRLITHRYFGGSGRLLSRTAHDVHIQLGRVNEAETIAHNALEEHMSAEFLMRIALTKMVKGQIDAARLYLNVLRDDLRYGRWAEGCLQRLRQDPDLSNEATVVEVRSLMIATEDAHLVYDQARGGFISAERQLLSLLEQNPGNRMAFEYLMAIHLINRDLDAFAAQLPRLKGFSYPGTPLLYEEAAMLYAATHPERLVTSDTGVAVCGCAISEQTVQRYRHLESVGKLYRELNTQMAMNTVIRELGNTYFTYYFFGPGQPR